MESKQVILARALEALVFAAGAAGLLLVAIRGL